MLKSIEEHFNFKFPQLYKILVESNQVFYESDSYLWLPEAEWVQPMEMVGKELCFTDNILEGLIPFAFTGAGDHWCWCKVNNEYKILLCPHDYDMAQLYAPDFEAWLFRLCLEYMSSIEGESVEEMLKLVNEIIVLLNITGNSVYSEELAALSKIPPFEYVWGKRRNKQMGFLSYEQLNDKIIKYFGSEFVNNEMQWIFD